jgi:peptidoglycan/xylan/chitin deacetylase (PgdA/CDA1 family)
MRCMKVICILYHDVVRFGKFESSGFLIPGADRYKLDTDEFDRHLNAIAGTVEKTPVALTNLDDELLDEQLLFTFDDGGASSYSVIADALENYGWRGYFFVTTNFVDTPRFLTRGQIRELRKRGHVIGSHSCSHPLQMSRCSLSRLDKEWTQSVKALEDILGESVDMASVPGGAYSKSVAESAGAAGIRALFTSEPTTRCWKVGTMCVLGRFTVRQGMVSKAVVRLISSRGLERFRQSASWKAKSVLKTVGGKYYGRLRNRLLPGTVVSSDDRTSCQ